MDEPPVELASGKLVRDEPADGVVRLRISNPGRRGALDHEILDALGDAVRGLDTRCLILTGSDATFSAGYDLGNLDGREFEEAAEQLVAHPFHDAIEAIAECPCPVVAALNGHAIGGGLELAISCDIRLAARGIRVGMPPAKLGLVYSHIGLRKFLELCGPANAAELFYVGADIEIERAAAIGLVNHVVEPRELERQALDMADEIAANAPLSVRGNKRIIRALRSHEGALSEDLERELMELREACFRTDDFREGVRAFVEKRAPCWHGR